MCYNAVMNIKYLGHSSFLLQTNQGSIVFDPHKDIGYDYQNTVAQVVSVSHFHYDHANVEGVSGVREVVTDGNFEGYGFKLESKKSFHDGNNGALRGINYIRKVMVNGLSFAHLGDFGEKPDDFDFSFIEGVDFLFVPVGGKYTVTADGAKAIVDKVRPKFIVPMHYKTQFSTVDISSVDAFLRYFPSSKIIYAGNELCVEDLINADLSAGRVVLFDMPDGQTF